MGQSVVLVKFDLEEAIPLHKKGKSSKFFDSVLKFLRCMCGACVSAIMCVALIHAHTHAHRAHISNLINLSEPMYE